MPAAATRAFGKQSKARAGRADKDQTGRGPGRRKPCRYQLSRRRPNRPRSGRRKPSRHQPSRRRPNRPRPGRRKPSRRRPEPTATKPAATQAGASRAGASSAGSDQTGRDPAGGSQARTGRAVRDKTGRGQAGASRAGTSPAENKKKKKKNKRRPSEADARPTAPKPAEVKSAEVVARAEPAARPTAPAAQPAPNARIEPLAIVFPQQQQLFSARRRRPAARPAGRSLAQGGAYEIALQSSVSGSRKVVGAESVEEAMRYNQWLAERRLERVRDWLGRHAAGRTLTFREDYRASDESRQVMVQARPAG